MTPDNDHWREIYVASARERRRWGMEGAAYLALGLFCFGAMLVNFGAFATRPAVASRGVLSVLCDAVVLALVVLLFGTVIWKGLALLLDALVAPRTLEGPITQREERRNPRGPATRSLGVGSTTLTLSSEGFAKVMNCPRARVEHGRFSRTVRRVWLPN